MIPANDDLRRITSRHDLTVLRELLDAVLNGLEGRRFQWSEGKRRPFTRRLRSAGITLVTLSAAKERGYSLKRGASPVGTGYFGAPIQRQANLYVLELHFRKARKGDEGGAK